ncbi:SCD1_1 [Blepharisma stoltei]|uniref:UDENN domain-containing protein n=1 Tax=Blepharisma stoltei TaxID=1481888 RepID=A0AAU9JYM6_9CILI|nr:unnamed protein product [Blepharisma stoltei]
MEKLFREENSPPIRLINSIAILGLQVKSLRNILIEGKTSGVPEVILQLPPTSKAISPGQINMIFTSRTVDLETVQNLPKFFSTTITNEKGVFTHMHCLITYEKISPTIIEKSKNRLNKSGLLNFVPRNERSKILKENGPSYYVPVALCIMTHSNYIDLFRNILESLYLHISEICQEENPDISSLLASTEFMRTCLFLLNDTIIPPNDIQISLKVGKDNIPVPIEYESRLPHNESCVAVLIDLIDIRNVIEFWESILLNKHAFLVSCNEYLLYLVLEAYKILLFPMKWSLSYIPVMPVHDVDYMEIPTPILIGINSNVISVEEAKRADSDATILDIDSNILYTSEKPLLCDCVKSKISKKIQLAKAYYYVNRNRLNTFRMHSLEQNLEDNQYVSTAKKLLSTPEGPERDEIFVSLIRHAFFKEFVIGIGKFSDYLSYRTMKKEYEMQKDLFLQEVKTCGTCTMKEFWKQFLDSVTFMQFLDFYEKFDDSSQQRFCRIVHDMNIRSYEYFSKSSCYELLLASEVSPRELYEQVEAAINSFEAKTSQEKFIKCSATEMIEAIKEKIFKHDMEYDRVGFNEGRKRSKSLIVGSSPMSNLEMNFTDVYYGEFGIIQVMDALMAPLTRAQFRSIGTSENQIFSKLETNKDNWQPLVLKFLFSLRKNKKNWDAYKLLDICFLINKADSSKLPKRLTANIIEKAYNSSPTIIYDLLNSDLMDGELRRLAEAYRKAREEKTVNFADTVSTIDRSPDFLSVGPDTGRLRKSLLRSQTVGASADEERKEFEFAKRKR